MSGITGHTASGHLVRLAVVFAVGMLTAACFQPLYGTQSASSDNSVGAKLSAIEIPDIPAPKGSATARLAVDLRNALLYNFNGGGNPIAPTYPAQGNYRDDDDVRHYRFDERPAGDAVRRPQRLLQSGRNCDPEDRDERLHFCARVVRHSRYGTALCAAACLARRRRPRRAARCAKHPQSAGIVFCGRHLSGA